VSYANNNNTTNNNSLENKFAYLFLRFNSYEGFKTTFLVARYRDMKPHCKHMMSTDDNYGSVKNYIVIIYSFKKVKDHYCIAVFWKSSPTDFVYNEENVYWWGQFLSFNIGWRRVWGYLKTFAPKNVIGCVVRHFLLGWVLLWLFYWLVRHP